MNKKREYLLYILLFFAGSLFSMNLEKQYSLFGTDGIRKSVGDYPLTHDNLPRLGYAIAAWAQSKYKKKNPAILMACDTRASCDYIKASLQSGLLLLPIVIFDAGTLPTPATHLLLKHGDFDCALIISASHNPYQDNGIKIIDKYGNKIAQTDELFISERAQQDSQSINYDSFGRLHIMTDAQKEYCARVQALFPENFLSNKKIVIDCANGATYTVAPAIFQLLGAQIITINNHPDGTNINNDCGSVHPQSLQKAVVTHQADAGFAFDGDGDRIIAVNRDGIVKDGDDILSLLIEHPIYGDCTAVVSTVMSNQGFEQALKAKNKSLIRTSVGDKYVCEQLVQNNLLLGGEPSGHIIMRDYLESSDGIVTALRIMEAIMHTNNYDMNTYKKFPQILINVPIKVKKDLNNREISNIIENYKQQLHAGRLLIRYSGTENLLRVMVEDDSYDHAQYIAQQLAQELAVQLC